MINLFTLKMDSDKIIIVNRGIRNGRNSKQSYKGRN